MSPLYLCFRAININEFWLKYYFKSTRWHKFIYMHSDQGARHDRMSIKDSMFFEMPILVPIINEQTKIANFFSLIDEKIEKQDQKVEGLEEMKKGLMQRIFNQDIRFKDDEGGEFPEWEEKKLGEIGTTYSGLSGKTKDDFGNGNQRFITYMNVFSNIIAQPTGVELVNLKENEKQNAVKSGDILFTTSSETPEEVGMASLCQFGKVYLNSFCFGFRPTTNEFNSIFLAYLLRSENIRRKISILAQGSTRFNLSKNQLMKMRVPIPSISEQTKIANFLSTFDRKIEKEKEKLEYLKEMKKGLMQKMFV